MTYHEAIQNDRDHSIKCNKQCLPWFNFKEADREAKQSWYELGYHYRQRVITKTPLWIGGQLPFGKLITLKCHQLK